MPMEMKGTCGALKCKPVITEMPGPGCLQLQALLPLVMATSVLRNVLSWDSRDGHFIRKLGSR